MTPRDFILWIQGYIEACGDDGLTEGQAAVVLNQIQDVDHSEGRCAYRKTPPCGAARCGFALDIESDAGEPNVVRDSRPGWATITVDNKTINLPRGEHWTFELKMLAAVPLAHALEQVIDGRLTGVNEDVAVLLNGGEQFISHVRGGASTQRT